MLKSCRYCGRIHDSKFDCGMKPKKRKKSFTTKDRFRSTSAWQDKREHIRQRDNNLCQFCIRKLYFTEGVDKQFQYNDLSVHHAIPMEEDYSKRLDDNNLITTCSKHHEMAEDGRIPLDVVLRVIKEQEEKKTVNLGIKG